MSLKNVEELVHRSYSSRPKYSEIMPGVPEDFKAVKTLGDLLRIHYKFVSSAQQLRGNLIRKLKKGEHPYPGIIGYDDDVIPAVNRAILSGHDILLVGQIGQAKTKLAESIATGLLSPIPVVRGTITNDIPSSIPEDHLIALLTENPIGRTSPEFTVSKECEEIIRNDKLETRVDWLEGKDRYKYILSTPDISVKDLVGQIDAIKIAKKGVELYDMESYSAGQLLQARHGILCIDELPVLDPRKQVALLSVLQEGRFTTGAYPAIFKPDVCIIATANPIDYTHSGKIIEPLFDRLRSHVDTHYPKTIEDEMLIVTQEARTSDGNGLFLPIYIIKTVARIAQAARSHHDINQDKGVSVRMAIHSMEVLAGEAERTRSILHDVRAVPRFCDIHSIHQSAKFELSEMEDNRENRTKLLNSIIEQVLKEISNEYLQRLNPEQISRIKGDFAKNKAFQISQTALGGKKVDPFDYEQQLSKFPGLRQAVSDTSDLVKEEQKSFVERAKLFGIDSTSINMPGDLDGEFTASVTELVLEGLRWTQPPLLEKKDGSTFALAQ